MKDSTRLILNTVIQYLRSIINMLLSLYSTRLILLTLGVEDYGIYTLIAGVVSMLSFLTSSLASTTQRFLSVHQGDMDIDRLRHVFSNCTLLHLMIGVFFVIALELLSPLLFDGFLNIPYNRIAAAKIVYQFVVVILFVTINVAPYRALVISHENIVYSSIIDVFDGIIKVLIALALQNTTYDKLELYGFLLLMMQIFNFLSFFLYDSIKYQEFCFPRLKYIRKSILKDVLSFAGWNTYSAACIVGRNQGLAIVINKFFGAAVNAAYGLSFQISGCVGFIIQSLKNAISPQTMKARGAKNQEHMMRLINVENKFAFTLLASVCIPVIIEMPALLQLWLKDVPEYAVLLSRMIMIGTLVDTLTTGFSTGNLAIGKLKMFSLVVYTLKLITPLCVLVALFFDRNIIVIAVIYVLMEVISSFSKIYCMSKLIFIRVKDVLQDMARYSICPISLSLLSSIAICNFVESQIRFIITIFVSFVVYIASVWMVGLNSEEKNKVLKIIKIRKS